MKFTAFTDDDNCPNSLIRQKEGAQVQKDAEAGDRKKGGPEDLKKIVKHIVLLYIHLMF